MTRYPTEWYVNLPDIPENHLEIWKHSVSKWEILKKLFHFQVPRHIHIFSRLNWRLPTGLTPWMSTFFSESSQSQPVSSSHQYRTLLNFLIAFTSLNTLINFWASSFEVFYCAWLLLAAFGLATFLSAFSFSWTKLCTTSYLTCIPSSAANHSLTSS